MNGRARNLQPEAITPEQNENLVTMSLKVFTWEPVDLHDPEQVQQRIMDYFKECQRLELRPANLGLYGAMGMTKQDVSDVLRGRNKSKVNPACIDLIKRAKMALSTYREGLAMSGRLNPVTAIFWGKNFDQMTDTQTLEVSRADRIEYTQHMTPEQIATELNERQKRIEQDIPIDEPAAIYDGDVL